MSKIQPGEGETLDAQQISSDDPGQLAGDRNEPVCYTEKMVERLYQGQFDLEGGQLQVIRPQEVTPKDFSGLPWPERMRDITPDRLSRFLCEAANPVQIDSPAVAGAYLLEHVFSPFDQFLQEELWTLLLNNKNWITHTAMIYRGTVNQVLVRNAEVFRPAIVVNAPAVIVAHCHPSGSPIQSPEDVQVTRHLVEAGKQLGIEVVDHIIVGNGRWKSLKDAGLGFDG